MKYAVTMVLIISPALLMANPNDDGYSNPNGNNGCYGTGCLPTSILQQVIKDPNYYNQENINQQKKIELLKESNEIAREQLELMRKTNNPE
jgi:hypothetical protein